MKEGWFSLTGEFSNMSDLKPWTPIVSIKSVYFTSFTLPKHERALSIAIKVEQILVWAMFIHRIIWGEF